MKTTIKLASVLLLSAFVFFACSKDENGEPAKITQLPEVGDLEISAITTASFRYKASVVNEGSSEITEKGICYGTSENPTTANSKTTDGKGKAIFTGSVEKLTAEKTYFVRAYATNSEGTGYGEQAKVTLLALKNLIGVEQGKPNEKGEVVTVKFNGKEVKATKKGGKYFISGDMLVKKDPTTKGVALDYEPLRWKNNTFVYKIDPDFPQKERIAQAIALFKGTNIRFKEQTDEKNYALFTYIKDDGCYSWVGLRNRGEQEIVIDTWAGAGTVAHEIAHALGLYHEQMKPNRDKYIKIIEENIIDGCKHNFDKLSENGHLYDEEFDFNSLMCYPSWAFAIDSNKPTMTKLNGTEFGCQREHFTANDIAMINKLYPKLADLEVFRNEISLEVGESVKVEITAGTGEYEIKSKNTDIATASISKNLITINALKEGVTEIVVTDKNTEQTKTIKVTVSPKTPDLAIDKTAVSLEVEQKATVNITAGSGNYSVKSSNEKIASATAKNGVITLTAKGEGTATITVKDNKTEQTKAIKVSVTAKTPDIAIGTPKINSLEKGQTATLLTITAGSGNYTVTSSDTKKATVTEKDGVVTVIAVGEGDVTITIKDNKTGQTKTVKLTVSPKTPDLAIEKTAVSLEEEQTEEVSITAGSGNYTVTSSDTNKATATEENGVITVTAKGEGTATITVKDNKTKQTKTIKVTVSPKTPNLAIDKTEVSLEVEQTEEVSITAGSGNYTVISSDTNKATATEENGIITVTAVGEGTAIVTVTDTKTQQTQEITVTVTANIPNLTLDKEEIKVIAGIELGTVKITGSGEYTVSCDVSDTEVKVYTSKRDNNDYLYIEVFYKVEKEIVTVTVTDKKTQQTKNLKLIIDNPYIELTVSDYGWVVFAVEKIDDTPVWIDLNEDYKMQHNERITVFAQDIYNVKDEEVVTYGGRGGYGEKNKKYRIYGRVIGLNGFDGYGISNIDEIISKNPFLLSLEIRSDRTEKIDVTESVNLNRLDIVGNVGSLGITELDLSKNSSLRSIFIDNHNRLTKVILPTTCPYLTYIHLSGCDYLTELENLSRCTELEKLNIRACEIKQLNLSNSTKLRDLRCDWNPLKSLDVSNCPRLGIGKDWQGNPYEFSFGATSITCVKVSQEQLNTLKDRNWLKGYATFSIDCE
ncbi:MAG: hypothetical protein KGV44_08335 [Flavobacteriaceae bacterium]|nr:hypothetical protein [Flavobacteriaceae bacterium]